MKNVYYDTYYDEQAGIMVPRFVKNAEFVLIPRFIKGTQFESVYKMMKDNDILYLIKVLRIKHLVSSFSK